MADVARRHGAAIRLDAPVAAVTVRNGRATGVRLAGGECIEGDRVGSLSIRFMLSKDKNWTKALKYMLVDLKFCLKATIALNSSGGAAAEEGAEGGARAPLGRGQRVGPLGRLDAAAAGQ